HPLPLVAARLLMAAVLALGQVSSGFAQPAPPPAASTPPLALPQVAAPPGGAMLGNPPLPLTLPGGLPLPSLPPSMQQEILQRIMEASGNGRAPAPLMPAAPAMPPPSTAGLPGGLPPSLPHYPMPAAPAPVGEPLSQAEAHFSMRLEGVVLRQFGYDTFKDISAAPPGQPPMAQVPDDYILGRDDEVLVSIRGRTQQNHGLRIRRDGMLMLPDLPPISAAGRPLGEVRAEIESRAARELGGSEAFVSLGQLRQIGVFIAGEVLRPGLYPMPALASVLDALALAGGVKKTGSLRAIRVEGPRGPRIVDLYSVIGSEAGTPDLALREGERIVVPPLGAAFAIAGEVTRPGIFEMPPGVEQMPLATLLRLAGQPLRPAGQRFLLQGTDAQGRRSLSEIGPQGRLRRGDAVLVQPGSDVLAGQVRLAGHVAAPLLRAAGQAGLRALLADPLLVKPDPYLRLAIVWRVDPQTRVRRFIGFDLGRLLQRQTDLPLRPGDEVLLISQADVLWLASPPVQRALRGEAATECPALQALAVAARSSPVRFAHVRGAGFPDLGAPPCPALFVDYPALLPYLLDQAVLLSGEARLPGLYPILDDTGLDQVLAAAGGLTDTVDLSAV
ncbi:polysaccharide biosynthesis/export family protein, partial [Teichococcus deserti]|uniref:polysaccharide biosynthesis/export family protein n=1 Tax=Teichococcus deserti TaxID=1817963 RepID=UPI0034630A39